MKNNNRNQTIDLIRILACFMVIFCHVNVPGNANTYIMALARFAVVYFLLISGWFLWKKDNLNNTKKYLKSTICFTVKSIIFITIINIIVGLINYQGPFDWFINYWKQNDHALRNFLLFNRAVFLSSVMWYLFALIYVIIIYYLISKFKLLKKSYFIIIPLIIVNIYLGYNNYEWYYSGNWLLTSLPFLLLGSYIHATNLQKKVSNKLSIILIILGIIITIIEAYFHSGLIIYIGTIPIGLGIFFLGLNNQVNTPIWISNFGRYCSPIIFIIHCSLRDLLYNIFGNPKNNILLWLMPMIFFIISSLISIIYIKIKKTLCKTIS